MANSPLVTDPDDQNLPATKDGENHDGPEQHAEPPFTVYALNGANNFLAVWETLLFTLLGFIAMPVLVFYQKFIKPVVDLEKVWTWVKNKAVELWHAEDRWGLRVYGDSLLTDKVRKELRNNGGLLDVITVFETFAWYSMWMYTGVGFIATCILTVIFMRLILLMDAAIMRMDDPGGKKRWGVILGRLSFVLFISCVTAVPTEMRVFGPDIDRAIEASEAANVAKVIEKGRETEQTLTDAKIAASDKALGGQPDAIVAQRKEDRKELAQRLADKSDQLAKEVGRGSATGEHTVAGDGPAAKALRLQETNLRADLTAFDAETSRLREAAVADSTAQRDQYMAELRTTLAENDKLSKEELAAKYGGDYKESSGFMNRFNIMRKLVETPDADGNWLTSSRLVAYGCRLVMIIFGLGTLFMKFVNSSKEQKDYYSRIVQATRGKNKMLAEGIRGDALKGDKEALDLVKRMAVDGDDDSQKLLVKMGYDGDIAKSIMPPEVNNARAYVGQTGEELVAAYARFQDVFRGMCHERNQAGLAVTRDQLNERSEKLWRKTVVPKVNALAGAQGNLLRLGLKLPNVGRDVNDILDVVDYRKYVWQLDDDDLETHYGWLNPNPVITLATPSSP